MAEAHSTVEYRNVPGFPGYRVGNDGSVWRAWVTCRAGRKLTDRWRRMKLAAQRKRTAGRRYLYVNLTPPEGGPYKTFRVHRLVLLAFVGPCPEGMESRHIDGDPTNNTLNNLVWGTPAENRADINRHGRQFRGETHPGVKLTDAQVCAIRARYAAGGILQRELAEEYGVNVTNIHAIVHRRSWKHID